MTASMAGNALNLRADEENTYERLILKSFSETAWASPDKAIVLEFSDSQMRSALQALEIR